MLAPGEGRMYCSPINKIVSFLLFTIFFIVPEPPNAMAQDRGVNPWASIVAEDQVVLHERGWGPRRSYPFNELKHLVNRKYKDVVWYDSPSFSPDGERIYFMVYDGEQDAYTEVNITHNITSDPDIWVSRAPFEALEKLEDYGVGLPYLGAAGPDEDEAGTFWFNANNDYVHDGNFDTDIYKGSILDGQKIAEKLPFNGDESLNNPENCVALDELWMDNDLKIFRIKSASKDFYSMPPELASIPINSYIPEVQDVMPHLSADCQTIWWASTRNQKGGVAVGAMGIWKAERIGEDQWSEPTLVLSSKYGVGEPTTYVLPDGRIRLLFLQIFRYPEDGSVEALQGAFTTGVFSITQRRPFGAKENSY